MTDMALQPVIHWTRLCQRRGAVGRVTWSAVTSLSTPSTPVNTRHRFLSVADCPFQLLDLSPVIGFSMSRSVRPPLGGGVIFYLFIYLFTCLFHDLQIYWLFNPSVTLRFKFQILTSMQRFKYSVHLRAFINIRCTETSTEVLTTTSLLLNASRSFLGEFLCFMGLQAY